MSSLLIVFGRGDPRQLLDKVDIGDRKACSAVPSGTARGHLKCLIRTLRQKKSVEEFVELWLRFAVQTIRLNDRRYVIVNLSVDSGEPHFQVDGA